jgi:subtilisin-like proprotein convertase family protein
MEFTFKKLITKKENTQTITGMKTISKIIFTVLMLVTISSSLKAQYVTNKAGIFNGSTSYVSCNTNADVDPRNGFTIEAWVYYEFVQGKTSTIYHDRGGIQLAINGSGNVTFTYNSTSTALMDAFPVEQWTHLAATYDGTTVKIYYNGQLNNTLTSPGVIPPPGSGAYVGGVWSNGTVFNSLKGMLDDVRIWTEARSSFNIHRDMYMSLAALMPTGTYKKLGLSLRFDAIDNGFVYDEAGYFFNGGGVSNVTLKDFSNEVSKHSTFNSSLILEGAGSYCAAPPNIKFEANSSVSVESWVKLGLNGPHSEAQEIISKGNASAFSYRMYMKNDSTAVFSVNAGSINSVEYKVADPFTWNHIAGTYNGQTGEMKLYVNGENVKSQMFTPAGIEGLPTDSLFIGKSASVANSELKGQLDEVRVWSEKIRSPQEIKRFMHLGITFVNNPLLGDAAVYGFDGRTDDVTFFANAQVSTALTFNGSAYMRSARANAPIYSASPIVWQAPGDFLDNTWNISLNRRSVSSSTAAYDSIYYASTGSVQDAKVMVLLNSANIHKVKLTLISPDGTSVQLTPEFNNSLVKCDLMSVFSDDANEVISYGENSLAPFSPSFKPFSQLSALNGKQRKGWWKLKIEAGDIGSASHLVKWGIQNSILTGTDPVTHTPDSYSLEQNYPNPFNPATTIRFNMSKPGFTSLKVYDILGKEVANLVNQNMNAGSHSINFNASALPSGVYFYKLETDGFTDVKKMSLIK